MSILYSSLSSFAFHLRTRLIPFLPFCFLNTLIPAGGCPLSRYSFFSFAPIQSYSSVSRLSSSNSAYSLPRFPFLQRSHIRGRLSAFAVLCLLFRAHSVLLVCFSPFLFKLGLFPSSLALSSTLSYRREVVRFRGALSSLSRPFSLARLFLAFPLQTRLIPFLACPFFNAQLSAGGCPLSRCSFFSCAPIQSCSSVSRLSSSNSAYSLPPFPFRCPLSRCSFFSFAPIQSCSSVSRLSSSNLAYSLLRFPIQRSHIRVSAFAVLFLLFRAHSVLLVCFLSEFGLHRFLETDTQGGTSSLPLFGVAAVSTLLRYPSSLKSRHSGVVLRIFDISHPPQGSNSDPRKHDRFATDQTTLSRHHLS
jgi:hypothetical protein